MSPMIVIARVSSRHTRSSRSNLAVNDEGPRRQPWFPTIYIQIVNKRFYCCFTVRRGTPAVPSARIHHIVNNLLLYNCIASCRGFGGLDFHESVTRYSWPGPLISSIIVNVGGKTCRKSRSSTTAVNHDRIFDAYAWNSRGYRRGVLC